MMIPKASRERERTFRGEHHELLLIGEPIKRFGVCRYLITQSLRIAIYKN
jgi:hypothetical protein